MEPNRTLIEKADLALGDLQNGNGFLTDQQADKYIRTAIKESVLLQQITVTPMRGPREERSKLRFAGRVLRPGSSATALTPAQRAKPDLSTFLLETHLFKAEVRLDDETMEDQIERGTFGTTVSGALAEATARDIEFVSIQGDQASGDVLLAVLDGFLKQATSNLVDVSAAKLTKDPLRDMYKALPDEFARAERMRFYTNRQARIDYRDSLAERATALGDASLITQSKTVWQDMPIVDIPEFPDSGSTEVLLTEPSNLTIGFHRKIRFERDRDVSAGVNIIVATVRFDVKIQEVDATSKGFDVSTA